MDIILGEMKIVNICKISLFLFLIVATQSCSIEDIDPEMLSNEITVECYLSKGIDTTDARDIWVSSNISDGSVGRWDYLGHCWNYNTETLPTISSYNKKDLRSDLPIKTMLYHTEKYSYYVGVRISTTSIPVSQDDIRLIIRGFVIFNDSLIRYSEPIILDNPNNYAH